MASSATLTHFTVGNIRSIQVDVVAAADGSFDDIPLPAFEGRILGLATLPSSPNPTSNYDITLVNQWAVDLLQGLGANRSASAGEQALITYSATNVHPVVDEGDVLALRVAHNSVNAAAIRISIDYALGYR